MGDVYKRQVENIFENSDFVYMLNQAGGDRQILAKQLGISTHQMCIRDRFGGTSNALDFLPLDRSGNRRFIPVMVYPEQAEVHILEDEAASRAYISQMWAEAMEIYRCLLYTSRCV